MKTTTTFNLENLVRPNVKAMKPYSSARDEFTDFDADMIFLDANENPFQTEVNRYPDPQQLDVKGILAAQRGVNVNQILLGNGSDEVLDLLFRAFCEPRKDNIITLPPTYGMYGVLAALNDVENREVLLEKSFEPNIAEILKVQDLNTKITFLCSPNNPTGNIFSDEKILELLKNSNGIVVLDEAYIDFSETESWLARLDEFPNLVITQTLSKAYGMAGIRLGICFASEEIIAILNKIKPPYNVNELTQQSAFERLVNLESVEQELSSILSVRNELSKALIEVDFVTEVFASQSNFILVRVDDANKRYDQLLKNKIVVRNRSSQPLCENTLRLTVGTSAENDVLVKTLKAMQK